MIDLPGDPNVYGCMVMFASAALSLVWVDWRLAVLEIEAGYGDY